MKLTKAVSSLQRATVPILRNLSRSVHDVAKSGFAGANVDRYNKARPSYPKEALDYIVEKVCGGKPISHVVELGAGTGKFTKVMNERLLEAGPSFCEKYWATEPSDDFRNSLADLKIPGVIVMAGTGESIAVPDNSVDVICVAQAFHWMANEKCLAEIHRALKPGGTLVLIWNAVDIRIKWLNELEEILDRRYQGGGENIPRYITQKWRVVFDKPVGKNFTELSHWTAESNTIKKSTAQDIVDRILSVSVVAMSSKEEQEKCKMEILHLLDTDPSLEGVKDGDYSLEYRTDMAYCRKI
jgi:SAM-dependent methyltransferase